MAVHAVAAAECQVGDDGVDCKDTHGGVFWDDRVSGLVYGLFGWFLGGFVSCCRVSSCLGLIKSRPLCR